MIYYYLWDYIIKEDEKLDTIKENMFRISYDLEKDNKYSTGANGVYKHSVYHNIIVVEKCNLEESCKALVSDFNAMVLTWKNQVNSFSKF